MWLNQLMGSQLSHLLQKVCYQKFVNYPPDSDRGPTLWSRVVSVVRPLLTIYIFDFFKTAEQNLTGRKILMSSTKFVFFGLIKKNKMAAQASDWIFDFSETAEWNSMKLDWKQDLNILDQVCVFSGRSEKQDGRHDLWLAEAFWTSPL